MFKKGKKKKKKSTEIPIYRKGKKRMRQKEQGKARDESSCSAFHSVPEVQNAIRYLNDLFVLIIKYPSFKSGCFKSVLKRSLINTST